MFSKADKTSILIVLIAIYFAVSFIPILGEKLRHPRGGGGEIFPFFSFKLYSKIPQSFDHFDLLLNDDFSDPKFLIHGNTVLNKLQVKAYAKILLGKASVVLEDSTSSFIEVDGYTGRLVRLRGDYVDAVLRNEYVIEPVLNTGQND